MKSAGLRTVLLLALLASAAASAQESYPDRVLRIIVPFAPGGASDFIARIVAAKCPEAFGQPCIVDNRPGASGNIGVAAAAKSPPDGYTALLGNAGTIAINPHLYRGLTVDPLADLAAVIRLASNPGLIVVHPSLPAASISELIEHARRHPGALSYGSPGAGSSFRLVMELMKRERNLEILEVPYKGGAGPAVSGLVAGDTQISLATAASVTGFLRAGRLRALATLSEQRLPAFPEVPTVFEAGLPRMADSQWQGLFLPRGAPPQAIARLHKAMTRILREPDVLERFAASSAQAWPTATPRDFARFVEEQHRHWAGIIAETGASAER
jgi:tripartite-type tricarboxylate transporter receptor subunit TctC